MSVLPLSIARVSNLLQTNTATQNIDSTQAQLLQVEQELSTGKKVSVFSDDPSSAVVIQTLQKTMDYATQYSANVTAAQSQLNETESQLGNVTTLLTQAQSIASANVASTTSPSARASAATVIDSISQQILSIANSQFEGTYLFGGQNAQNAPYNSSSGGVEFTGTTGTLSNTVGTGQSLGFQVSGDQVFGGLSSSISTGTNIAPKLEANTRISDLTGATNSNVSLGSIVIGNGTTTATVNLSNAASVGDIVDDINAAGLAGVTASIGQYGLQLATTGGATLSVNEVGHGTTAADLGILQTTPLAANLTLVGGNLGAKLTDFTPLTDINGGTAIDPTGFNISNGSVTKTITLNGLNTVGDLVNAINTAGVGARAQINAAGTGIDLYNATQGTPLTVSEIGGTTATQLGFRTYGPNTLLSSLNNGSGVSTPAGNQFDITTADGSLINFSLNNVTTVQDVINQINTQGGGKITAAFATNGNGIVLTDTTSGTGKFFVTPLNGATTAADLGLTTPAVGNTITGADVNPSNVSGIFADLKKLSDALNSNNTAGITEAAQGLTTDSTTVNNMSGDVGAQLQDLGNRATDLTNQSVANQTLLSSFQDVDYTTAVTTYQTLQTSLQAALETTSRTLQLTLLDYVS
jgi:flagellin-like hook-associated protein FlgL